MSYVVTNVADEDLTNIVVTDDQGAAVICPQTTLGSTGTMTCTATRVAAAGLNQVTGTAQGTVEPTGEVVADSDPSHYEGVELDAPMPDIGIEKATNGDDADAPASGPTLSLGTTVNWTYVVTNTGNVPLEPVIVTDSDPSVTVECQALEVPLRPGSSRTCTATGLALTIGAYANTGTATGTPSDDQGVATGAPDVSASDLSHYTGVDFPAGASIDIEKATEGADADDPPGRRCPSVTRCAGPTSCGTPGT